MENLIKILQDEIKSNLPETSGKLLKEELGRLHEIEALYKEQEKSIEHLQKQIKGLQETQSELEKEANFKNLEISALKGNLKIWEQKEQSLITRENQQTIIENNSKNAKETTDKIFELVDKFVTKKRYITRNIVDNDTDFGNGVDTNGNCYNKNKDNSKTITEEEK